MRRLVITVAVLALLLPLGPRPAAAHTDACVGNATLVTEFPLTYPLVGPSRTGGFILGPSPLGLCAALSSLSMTGTVTGNCLLMNGAGTTSGGIDFIFVVTGTTAVFEGGLRGTADIKADPFMAANSCFTGARYFIVTFALLHLHVDGGGPPPPNTPPNTPTLVAPGDGAAFATTDLPVFTVNATDPQNHSYTATIELQQVGSSMTQVTTTTPTSSGSNASATFGNLPPGDYRWRAQASDAAGSSGWSVVNAFTVTLT